MGIKTLEVPGDVSVLEGAMNKVCDVGLGREGLVSSAPPFCVKGMDGKCWVQKGEQAVLLSQSVTHGCHCHPLWRQQGAGHRAQVLSFCGEGDRQSPQRRHRSGSNVPEDEVLQLLGLQGPP